MPLLGEDADNGDTGLHAGELVSMQLEDIDFHRSAMRTIFQRLGKKVSIPKVHPHRFRHTFATWAIEQQARKIDVQFLLGHSTPAMLRRYTATCDAEKAAQAHALFSPADSLNGRFHTHRSGPAGGHSEADFTPNVQSKGSTIRPGVEGWPSAFQAGCRGFDSRLPLRPASDVTTHATRRPPEGGLLLSRQVVGARSAVKHRISDGELWFESPRSSKCLTAPLK